MLTFIPSVYLIANLPCTHVKFPPHHSETVTQVKSQISKCVKNGIFEKLSHKMLQMNEREFDTRHFYHGKKFLFSR